MVGASKILTVSYGTFSCTLEGFDDPFSTMRGIAEYFRDLAADDRYFGAEPPTPDAEMLHRIAQAEVQRRVEARVSDDGIVLRQVTQQAEAAEAEAAPVASPDVSQETAADAREDRENMFADLGDADDEAAATTAAFPPATDGDTSVAAKLSRIRAVVSGKAEAVEAEYSGPIEAAFADVEPEDEGPAIAPFANDIGAEAEADAEPASEPAPQPAPETTATEAPSTPEDKAAVAEAEMPAPDAATPMVEATADETPADVPAESELSHEADMTALTEAEDAADLMMMDGAGHPETDEAPLAEETLASAEDEANLWAEPADSDAPETNDLAGASSHTEPEAAEVQKPLDEDIIPPKLDDEKLGLAARIVQLKRAAMGTQDLDLGEPPVVARDITLDDETTPEETAPEAPDTTPGLLQRSGDVDEGLDLDFDLDDPFKREDDLAALPVEDYPSETEMEDASEAVNEPIAEEDDDLSALIAEAAQSADEVENAAESSRDDEDTPDTSTDAEVEADPSEAADRLSAFEPEKTGDAAFDRILEQTNSRMDDTEGNRRRSAIAHLKAAVAATKADRLMKRKRQPDEEAAEEQSQYRDDLAQVVRPRRAEAAEDQPRDERPELISEKTSPLVLVSEQRVDAEDVAPRRVASEPFDPEHEAEAIGGFRAFAEKMGATELPDLLEAAAAYSAFVEGQREFSRPQLMRRVANFEAGGEFTREAGLRSFGQLLRQGKIQKLKRGQFTITEETRFNPEARIAGE